MFLTGYRVTLSYGVYPFERFSEDGKRVLTVAQEEAERSGHSYIGTEHLLLAMLRLDSSPAGKVMRQLGIEIEPVRKKLAEVIGRNERTLIPQIIPTSRVKQVIEIAFDEARRMGHEEVNSAHMLLALVLEGEGIAAHVLADLGADARRVTAEVERELGVPPTGRGNRPRPRRLFPFGPPRSVAVPGMRVVARPPAWPGSDAESLHHLLAAPHIAELLRARGLDVEALAQELRRPPESIRQLRMELSTLRSDLQAAVAGQDFRRAGQLQKREGDVGNRLLKAEQEWLKGLGR